MRILLSLRVLVHVLYIGRFPFQLELALSYNLLHILGVRRLRLNELVLCSRGFLEQMALHSSSSLLTSPWVLALERGNRLFSSPRLSRLALCIPCIRTIHLKNTTREN